MNLTPWRKRNPAPVSNLQTEMNRMFEDFFSHPFNFPATSQAFQVPMAIDLKEDDKTITVTAELPGVDGKDVQISVHDDVLEIKGHKSEEKKRDEENLHVVERSYGSFARRVLLPAEVDSDHAEARMDKGVLTLKLPKLGPKAGKKTIKID